jgi:hypothetical protein
MIALMLITAMFISAYAAFAAEFCAGMAIFPPVLKIICASLAGNRGHIFTIFDQLMVMELRPIIPLGSGSSPARRMRSRA